MKSQGILEQRPVTLRRTLSLLKPWAFTCRHESPLLIGRCRPSRRVTRREACEQTAAPAVREACEQTAVQAHREASPLTRLRRPPSSQLLPLLMSPAPQFKINPALPRYRYNLLSSSPILLWSTSNYPDLNVCHAASRWSALSLPVS